MYLLSAKEERSNEVKKKKNVKIIEHIKPWKMSNWNWIVGNDCHLKTTVQFHWYRFHSFVFQVNRSETLNYRMRFNWVLFKVNTMFSFWANTFFTLNKLVCSNGNIAEKRIVNWVLVKFIHSNRFIMSTFIRSWMYLIKNIKYLRQMVFFN